MNNQATIGLFQNIPGKVYIQRFVEVVYNITVLSFIARQRNHLPKKNEDDDCNNNSFSTSLGSSLIERFTSHLQNVDVPLNNLKSNSSTSSKPSHDHKNLCQHLDPDDFFHACKNQQKNTISCCVEPYIEKGYMLHNMSLRYYLKVLWIPNNEMFNVWTHLIPCIYFMWMLHDFNQTVDLVKAWPLLLVTVSAIFLTGLSSLAHMFHSRTCFHHRWWFLIDYFGITVFAFGSTVSHFFACSEVAYYQKIGCYNIVVLTTICWAGYLCCTISKVGCGSKSIKTARNLKVWSNAAGYFHGLLPIMYRFSSGEDPAMFYHKLQVLFMTLAPIWYASDIPQKYWPGKFDIIGHSHQIFHIFGALACYFNIQAVYTEVTHPYGHFSTLSLQEDYPTLQTICFFVVLLTATCLSLVSYLSKYIPPFEACARSQHCICSSFCSFSVFELLSDRTVGRCDKEKCH